MSDAGLTILEGVDVLHLRRDRRPRRTHERALRRGHALPLPARAAHRRRAAAPALLGEGRVLLGGLLPPQPSRARAAAAGRALDLARAVRRRRDAGPPRPAQREQGAPRVRARARGRHRLRGHHLGQGARLRARHPEHRAAAARRRRALRRRREPARPRGGATGGAKTQVLLSQPGDRGRLVRASRSARRPASAGSCG